ncbi:MAG TPA: AAA family ATPase [Acidimicrobiales bacterium]|nr:AAA family ATPase [Acidimicrobiales bacterium]
MEIRQVIRDVRRNLAVALAVFIACLVIGVAAAVTPAKQYKATTLVAAQVNPGTPDVAGAVQEISVVMPQLPVEATTDGILAQARANVPEPYRAKGASVDATSDPGTFIVTIDATSTSPKAASMYANAVAEALIRHQPKRIDYVLDQLSKATPPGAPSNPRTPIVLGAAVFGVILGIFGAMWAAGIRRRLSRVTEVKERIGATVLGEVPRVGVAGLRPAELFVKHTEPMAMEAFQELRSNLLISLPAGASATIAVTSCDPGEGKTSVATNIAWALAAQDRHVTAIDCDLRKPALHTQMGVPFGPGVTSRRTEDALAHASRTSNPYLDVIPAGIIDRHPSDIVSAHLPLLIDELRERHETTVIDCPPLIGVAETVLIAAMVDLVIVVVDARRFNPERLQQSLLRLDTANSNVAIVLNRVRFNRQRRDGAYGYGHFRRAEAPPPAPAAPVVAANVTPARPPRANGRRATIERPEPLRAPGPKVLRSPSNEASPGSTGVPEVTEQKGRSGYWQR